MREADSRNEADSAASKLDAFARAADLDELIEPSRAVLSAMLEGDATVELVLGARVRSDARGLVVEVESSKLDRARLARIAKALDVDLARAPHLEALLEIDAASPGRTRFVATRASNRKPELEVFFDLGAQGPGKRAARLDELLVATQAGDWRRALPIVRRGTEYDVLEWLSLRIGAESVEVSIHAKHHEVTLGALGLSEAASRFCRALGGTDEPFLESFARSTLTLGSEGVSGDLRSVITPTAALAPSLLSERLAASLRPLDFSSATFAAALAASSSSSALAMRDVALSSDAAGAITVTLRLGASSDEASADSPAALRALSPLAISHRYEHEVLLADHPFFKRLGREPVSIPRLWLVMANFWEAIVHDFPGRIARVVARIDDDAVRCVLVKQLNDELGEGDFSRAHKALFKKMLDALEPHRMETREGIDPLAPGREFGRRLGELLFDGDQSEAIGALMMIEIYGSQTDTRLGQEFKRQKELDPKSLLWLNLHETLELDHADDSMKLARLLPEEDATARRSAWKGAAGVASAGQAYFDALYAICFE